MRARIEVNEIWFALGGRWLRLRFPFPLERSCWRYAIRKVGFWRALRQRGWAFE